MKINGMNELTTELKYNWNKIWKEYKALNIPNHVWTPLYTNMNSQSYIVNISERSTGKTTQWLLLALVMNKLYKTTFAYMRQFQQQITPKNCGKVFETLKEFGYIEKITNNKYQDIYLWGGVFRYCNRDEKTQKIIEESEPIGYALSVDNSEIYKSNFNVNTCDIVIFDEFISNKYTDDEFNNFLQLLSTVGRQRAEFYIIMLGNTLNYYNKYLQELGINREIRKMKFGDKRMIENGMVKVFVELISMEKQKQTKVGQLKEKITLFRFGFGDSRFNALTGGDWNIKQYPHIPNFVDIKNDLKFNSFIVKLNEDSIKGTLYQHKNISYILFTPYNSEYKGDIRRYTLSQPLFENERYSVGYSKSDVLIWTTILKTDKVYFATNDCGLILDEYIKRCNVETFI